MLSCKEVTEKANEFLDKELPFFVRMKVNLHLLICKHCDHYMNQLRITIQALGKMKKQESVDDTTVDDILHNLKNTAQSGDKTD